MSRLIVKNLPPDTTPARLRAHFTRADGPGGALTDVRVPPRRGFGFVGYKTDAEAARAREWFDKTYLGGARVAVELVAVRARRACLGGAAADAEAGPDGRARAAPE
jgi:multiple RNA-binding domain-containing protein 1